MNDEQRYIYDLIAASAERTVKRLWVLIILLIMVCCTSNACWIWYESQYEDSIVTQEVDARSDGDSDINLNTVNGDMINGRESESKTNSKDAQP